MILRPRATDCDTNNSNLAGIIADPLASTGLRTFTTIPRASAAGACPSDQPAWYYDVPSAPTKIVLCENACDAVSAAGDGAQLNVVAGCTDTVIVVQ